MDKRAAFVSRYMVGRQNLATRWTRPAVLTVLLKRPVRVVVCHRVSVKLANMNLKYRRSYPKVRNRNVRVKVISQRLRKPMATVGNPPSV